MVQKVQKSNVYGGRAMNYKFKIVPHSMIADKQAVEFWREGVFVAGIYPHEDGIRIVSKYMDGVEHEPGYPPAAIVHLSKEKSV